MVVVGSTGTTRTFLATVNKTLNKIGESSAATLLGPTRRIALAMEAVREARNEVFYRTLWEWRRAYDRFLVVEDTMWYELPTNFDKMATGPTMDQLVAPLQYISYEQLISLYPDIRSFPPGSGVVDLSTIGQLADQTHNFGTPKFYTLVNGYIGLMPIPDEDFDDDEAYLHTSYWTTAGDLTSDNDDMGVSRDLYLAVDNLAAGILKKILEFSDWQADYQIGTHMLRRQSNEDGEPDDTNLYNHHSINYND